VKPVFADTSYYLAYLNPDDVHHSRAVELSRTLRRRVIVSEFVLLEVANALSRAAARGVFAALLRDLRSDPDTTIVPASADLFQRGCQLHSRIRDKDWSLTDCTSFVVMTDAGLSEALTADHHFEQAGFLAMLRG
jgi:uncharacterized protein